MSGRKKTGILIALVLSVTLIGVSAAAFWMVHHNIRIQYEMTGRICQKIIEEHPDAEQAVLNALKAYKNDAAALAGENILPAFGYQAADLLLPSQREWRLFASVGFLTGSFLFLLAFWLRRRREALRIGELTDYLQQVNTGGDRLVLQETDDEFSRLQDEIYKTVTLACQTRDAALEAKQKFAENLSNIAHQLKTPITAMSLSAQMIKEPSALEYAGQIQKQLKRLTHLEESLLLLSRLDAGTLPLERRAVDVFTLLTLASDNLTEMFAAAGVEIDVREMGEIQISVDLDWTMEAVMNLLKNCMEHAPGGSSVHCSYEQNPLYTQILIWDEGAGFAGEDIPHLFERFYRGKNASDSGIGIGLSLAKEIIERENGTIRAENRPEGGACFEIRFYSH